MVKPYNPHDKWMVKAKKEGYRARSVYKLMELDQKYHLFHPGMKIIDIGAAPGSWLQYVSEEIGNTGLVIGLDLQEIKPVSDNVITKVCDINNFDQVHNFLSELNLEKVDMVISDIAPSTSGIKYLDQKRSIELNESIVDVAYQLLQPGGILIMKVFQGESFHDFINTVKKSFHSIRQEKVTASRDRSREIYLVCKK